MKQFSRWLAKHDKDSCKIKAVYPLQEEGETKLMRYLHIPQISFDNLTIVRGITAPTYNTILLDVPSTQFDVSVPRPSRTFQCGS